MENIANLPVCKLDVWNTVICSERQIYRNIQPDILVTCVGEFLDMLNKGNCVVCSNKQIKWT